MLKLYNTLSGDIETFKPIDPTNVRMYVCGPTVYDRPHIGNARPAVVFDLLYRLLMEIYPRVTYVRNITDVDDKIYYKAKSDNLSIDELTARTISQYHSDIKSLNVLAPDIEPRATFHIKEMVNFIEELLESGNAYVSHDHVYFDVLSVENYGQLSKKNTNELLAGSRVDISHNKKNPLDFVLWKPISDDFNVGWDGPAGIIGRPGWHSECSAMSRKYLGETFDIHGGGIDLIFPHHENEIAQSSCINGGDVMAKYWIHNGHFNVDGEKMSKSLGNFFTIYDLLKRYDGETIRLAFMMSHYSSSVNFCESTLEQAKNIIDRWYNAIKNVKIVEEFCVFSYDVFEALLDNLNTPKALSFMHNLVKDGTEYSVNVMIYTARKLLGLLYKTPGEWFHRHVEIEDEVWIMEMIEKRSEFKKSGDYKNADLLREKMKNVGIFIEDLKDGTTIWRKI